MLSLRSASAHAALGQALENMGLYEKVGIEWKLALQFAEDDEKTAQEAREHIQDRVQALKR